MSLPTPERRRLDKIDTLRSKASTLTSRWADDSITDELRGVGYQLDDAATSLTQNRGAGPMWRMVLLMTDAVIKNAAMRLTTVERLLKVDPDVKLRSQCLQKR